MIDDIIGGAIVCLFVAIAVAVVIGLGSCAIDNGYYERHAFKAITACEARRMEAHRRLFDTAVVCVPINTRQDTTTVNVNAK